jgi:2,3-diketo-5-methylthio-1-phosphopentane phosphatase
MPKVPREGTRKSARLRAAAAKPAAKPAAAKPAAAGRPARVILDIEGTTTLISFVKDTLFPYSVKHLPAYLAEIGCVHAFAQALFFFFFFLTALFFFWFLFLQTSDGPDGCEKHGRVTRETIFTEAAARGFTPTEGRASRSSAALAECFAELVRLDIKLPALKVFQGSIWKKGYADGDLVAHIFDDVPPALRAWHREGVPIYIYSSGSIPAQKLLFGHTGSGDLLPLISGHFDLSTGSKREPGSYTKILREIGGDNPDGGVTVFATDIIEEAQAAASADPIRLKPVLMVRPGNATLPPKHSFPVCKTFTELRKLTFA